MALKIDWREPPPSAEDRLRAELKANPGRWARIKTNMSSPTSCTPWRKEGFEAQAAPAEEQEHRFDIYVRWPATKTSRPATAKAPPAPKRAPADDPPADRIDMAIPTSGDITGGYLQSRAKRGVPATGADHVRLAGHGQSTVRP